MKRFVNGTNGGPVHVYVEDGRIVRIVPIVFDETDAASWTIEARGRRFSPPRKVTLSQPTVAHRSLIYSPKRILTPLKRVDFDAKGKRNIQNRGTSGYEPISWDEALDTVAEEIVRVKREVGTGRHPHHPQLAPHVGQHRLPAQRLLPLHEPGGLHLRGAQPR